MLESFTIDTFQNRVGEPFTSLPLTPGDEGLDLELIECAPSRYHGGERPGASGASFSLVFLNTHGRLLGQRIHRLRHADLGEFELFLVPLGPDPRRGGMRYEAVFG